MNRFLVPAFMIIAGLFVLGCSGSGGIANPAAPDIGISPDHPASEICSAHRDLWGWWGISIDPLSETVEVIPMRNSQFRANVTQFLQPPAGNIANLQIDIVDISSWFDDGSIVVDVSLTHPFPGFIEYTGFDVNGIFINDGPEIDSLNNEVMYAINSTDAAVLKNPDGYTRWFNYPDFDGSVPLLGYIPGALGNMPEPMATLNPYKYFADGMEFDDDVAEFIALEWEDRGMFKSGVTNTRRYDLQFPMDGSMPVLRFQYAVAASWEPTDPSYGGNPDVWDLPDDYPMSANQQEPFHLAIDTSESSLYYVDETNFGGVLAMDIEVFHWQNIDPAGTEGIRKLNISSCESCTSLQVAQVYEGPALDDALVPGSGTAVSSVWHVEISGLAPTESGEAPVLVAVEPVYPETYEQGFGTPIPDGPLAAYKLAWVDIGVDPGCVPPTCYAEATTSTDIPVGNSVTFDASATTGTPPFTWDWDWDGDGTYDESTDQPIIEHTFNDMGTFYVMCRASNACGDDEIDEPIEVTCTCGTGTPTYNTRYQGWGDTCAYYFSDLCATYHDPVPKLVAPGIFASTFQRRNIYLSTTTNPSVIAETYTWSGTGNIYGRMGRMEVDGSTTGIDRIIFNPNVSPSAPVFVDWDGSDFSNETTLPPTPYGSIWTLCVTDEGDIIAHNNIGPNTSVYLWDKQNNYAVELLFTFSNTSASVPYGSSLGNIGKLAYDPGTETLLIPVSNGNISYGGQLYAFELDGTRVFADSDVFEQPVGAGGMLFGVTVDMTAPDCRVIYHGAPNNGHMWLARYVNNLEDKYVAEITDPSCNSGGKDGAFADGAFWTNTNNWNWHVIRYDLPDDW